MSKPNDKLNAMKPARLNEILEKAAQGKADINDVVEIVGGTLVSVSRSNKEIKAMMETLIETVGDMAEKVDFLYKHNSPIYSAVLEDDEEEEDGDPED